MLQLNDNPIMIAKKCKDTHQRICTKGRKYIGKKANVQSYNVSLPEVPKKLVSKSNKRSGKKDMTTIGSAEEVTPDLSVDDEETKTSATASSTTLTSTFGKLAALENKERSSTFPSEVSKDPGSVSRQASVPIDTRERSKTRAKDMAKKK